MNFNFYLVTVWVLFILDNGAVGVEVNLLALEGDSITLHTNVNNHEGKWCFYDTRLAEITEDKIWIDVNGAKGFKNRLKVDHQTGSLTITNTRTTDSGEYKLKIFDEQNNDKIFKVSVQGAKGDETKSKPVKEGESVTLNSGVIKNPNDEMMWYFSDSLIAQITLDPRKTCTDVQCNKDNEIFRDRLKVDHQTGSLTITNTTNTDAGEYRLLINTSDFSISRVKDLSFIPPGLLGWEKAAIFMGCITLLGFVATGVICYRKRTHTPVSQNENDDDNL